MVAPDQHHYNGVAALELCMRECGLKAGSRVIQLGSGVGGPSRYLAAHGCTVLAVELQDDLHTAAKELTARCGLDKSVVHTAANFLSLAPHLADAAYDCICSWLTVLHFDRAERSALFADCLRVLKPGGVFYAEDFFELAEFTPQERQLLRHDVFCKYLPTLAVYQQELVAAGFEVVGLTDVTREWTAQTQARVDAFEAQRAESVRIHGAELVQGLAYFYTAIARLFAGGHCGGVRVVVRKPMPTTVAVAAATAGN